MKEAYPFGQFLADLNAVLARTRDEAEILEAVAPLAACVARDKLWLTPRVYEADSKQGFGSHPLHQGPDFTPFVTALSWLPGRGAPPHDHGTWAVVVGVEGEERNLFWKRTDDRSRPGHADLEPAGERRCGPGDILKMPSGTIHEVRNESNRVSLSFHVYGRPLNSTGRKQFDTARHTEAPFLVKFQDP
jgi:predicted metal-dependent enzyme (double-stranded beta helix superfamily)